MASWAAKRKTEYVTGLMLFLLFVVGLPVFLHFYKAPTCFDGEINQGEKGIDCGGPCKKLCQADFLPAIVMWAGSEKVAAGLYNLGAYIQNPNVNGAAVNVPYRISVFDADGIIITEARGLMTIPANRNTLAFIGAVNTGKRVPGKGGVVFEFLNPPVWRKSHDTLGVLSVIDKKYTEDLANASLQVTLANTGLVPLTKVNVYSILADANGNELAFSKTLIDSIAAGDRVVAPFTWPFSNNGKVISEEVLPVVDPVFDTL
jgi:hypothetical protein